jgi:hypothetical protein
MFHSLNLRVSIICNLKSHLYWMMKYHSDNYMS